MRTSFLGFMPLSRAPGLYLTSCLVQYRLTVVEVDEAGAVSRSRHGPGAAWATERITTLITGDLAFFYDRNGLWHNHVPANLRVIILNNHGGGIFKLIDGPGNLPGPELQDYFFTPHALTAKNTAVDYNCDYYYCNDRSTLRQQLAEFFTPRSKAAILEIDTDSDVNTAVFRQVKTGLAKLTLG